MGAGIAASPHCPWPVRLARKHGILALERVPAEALRPRSVPFRVPRPAPKRHSKDPRVARRSEPRRVPCGFLWKASSPPVPGTAFPKQAPAAFPFRFPMKQASSVTDRPVDEANFDLDPFAVSIRPKASGPLDRCGKVGSAPAFAFASRFFPSAPGLRSDHRLSRRSAASAFPAAAFRSSSRFRENRSSAALGQCASDSIRASAIHLWITGISGIESCLWSRVHEKARGNRFPRAVSCRSRRLSGRNVG
jgi:hypothetical protein